MKRVKNLGATPQSSPPPGSPDSTADSIASTINQSDQHDHTPPDSEASAAVKHDDFPFPLPYDVWDEGPGPEDDPYDPGDFYKDDDSPTPGRADEDDDACLHCTGMDCTYCNKDVYAWEGQQ